MLNENDLAGGVQLQKRLQEQGFSPAQQAYILAKAFWERVNEQVSKLARERCIQEGIDYDHPAKEHLERWADICLDAEEELGWYEVCEQLRQAENQLLDWFERVMKQDPQYRERLRRNPELAEVWTKGRYWCRDKLIDLAMRFRPPNGINSKGVS